MFVYHNQKTRNDHSVRDPAEEAKSSQQILANSNQQLTCKTLDILKLISCYGFFMAFIWNLQICKLLAFKQNIGMFYIINHKESLEVFGCYRGLK